jgi:hypothetical protein
VRGVEECEGVEGACNILQGNIVHLCPRVDEHLARFNMSVECCSVQWCGQLVSKRIRVCVVLKQHQTHELMPEIRGEMQGRELLQTKCAYICSGLCQCGARRGMPSLSG